MRRGEPQRDTIDAEDSAERLEYVVKKIPLVLLAILVTAAYGADSRMKPGLWEVRIVKRVMDGRDQTAQMAGLSAQMQQAMANLPPDQRARIQSTLKHNSGISDVTRTCISPEMAKRDAPIIDQAERCQPTSVKRNGEHTTFEFNCNINGTTSTGKGESTISGDVVTTQTDITMHTPDGATHVMQNESEMRFISPDCGDVKARGP